MKRTRAITLAILGAIALSGCAPQEPKEATTYTNVAECTADGYATDVCQKAIDDAKKLTEQNGPRFATADQCAAQFGNCQKSSSGDWFMPALMGYMVGNMMSNGSRSAPTPIYIDRDHRQVGASYAGGVYRPVAAAPTYTARSTARAAAARASTSSRGGFGGRSGGSFGG